MEKNHLLDPQLTNYFCRAFIALSLSTLFASGCSHPANNRAKAEAEKKQALIAKYKAHDRTYTASAESVWKAAQKSLKYPIAIDNMENGILETDWIKGEDAFVPAHETKQPSSGVRSKITVRVLRGKKQGKDATRVTVTKQIERQRDFFDDGEGLETDGWEERIILYRIERELAIDRALDKGAFKGSK